jgi:hypothetical protein
VARRTPQTPAPAGPLFNRDDLGKPEWTNAVATARDFLRRHASDFLGVAASRQSAAISSTNDQRRSTEPPLQAAAVPANSFDPDTDLAPLRAERDALGMTHVRFHQTYRGLPVFGTELIVHLAPGQQVSSAGGRLVPGLKLDPVPTLPREFATNIARLIWQDQFHTQQNPEVRRAELCVLTPGLLKNNGDPAAWLVWEVKLQLECKECDGKPLSLEDYYIDAHSGELREQITGIQHINRFVYDCSYDPGSQSCGVNRWVSAYQYWFGISEGATGGGGFPRGPNPRYLPEISTDTDDLFVLIGQVFNYQLAQFGRNGLNCQGGSVPGSDITKGFTYTEYLAAWSGSCPGGASFSPNFYTG